MAAAQRIQSSHPDRHQATWGEHARQFFDGPVLLAGGKMHDHVQADHHIESAGAERKRCDVG